MRASCAILSFVLLCSLALSALPLAARAVLPPADIAYVIVTSADLATAFEPLATFKTSLGLPTQVVTLEWITANVAPGVDQPATIRAFLQEAHAQWGTAYVLLGGSLDVVPTRWVHSGYYPNSGGTDIPADLYFAGLDGNWDGDGDGVFGEPYRNADDPGDAADLQPDLALGRAPVTTPAEAALFAAKSMAFHLQGNQVDATRALLVADVIFPGGWAPGGYIIVDGGTHAEIVRERMESANPPWLTDRYYENHTAYPGTMNALAPAVLSAMASGSYRLVDHFAWAWGDTLEVGQGMISGSQLFQLANPMPFFFVSLGSATAAHDGRSALVQTLLAPNGGCAGALGATRAAFQTTSRTYIESFYQHALAVPGVRVGDALVASFLERTAYTAGDHVDRWAQLTTVLLGDPTASLSWVESPVSNEDGSPPDDDTPVQRLPPSLTAAPNPFNPQVEIRAELEVSGPARLSICDVRGREVRELFAGVLASGESHWQWDGRDAAGRASPSGVYLLRLETNRRILMRSVTLAR